MYKVGLFVFPDTGGDKLAQKKSMSALNKVQMKAFLFFKQTFLLRRTGRVRLTTRCM